MSYLNEKHESAGSEDEINISDELPLEPGVFITCPEPCLPFYLTVSEAAAIAKVGNAKTEIMEHKLRQMGIEPAARVKGYITKQNKKIDVYRPLYIEGKVRKVADAQAESLRSEIAKLQAKLDRIEGK